MGMISYGPSGVRIDEEEVPNADVVNEADKNGCDLDGLINAAEVERSGL